MYKFLLFLECLYNPVTVTWPFCPGAALLDADASLWSTPVSQSVSSFVRSSHLAS